MIDLQQLRYFVAVAEFENVGRAAAALNITQSPLSRQIMALEAKLGITLFERSKKRLRLTAAGRELEEEARALLLQAERLQRKAASLARGEAGTLRLGYVNGALHAGLLARALEVFQDSAPAADVELRAARSAEQSRQIEAGHLDLGIVYSRPPAAKGQTARLIYREGFRLAMPARTVRGADDAVSAADLDGASFVGLPSSDYPLARRDLMAACEAAGFLPDIRYEAADPLAVLEMVKAGLGFALVQASLEGAAPAGVLFAEPPPAFQMDLTLWLIAPPTPAPLVASFIAAMETAGLHA